MLLSLKKLNQLLNEAVIAVQAAYKSEAVSDDYQGLYISHNTVKEMLNCDPMTPSFHLSQEVIEEFLISFDKNVPTLTWLQEIFELSAFDLAVIAIAFAPERDLRYERIYGYLQDDVTRKRPTIDLALNLLCPTVESRIMRQAHFTPDAPLVRHNLLYLVPDSHQTHPPFLAHYLKLDERILHLLLEQQSLDSRLIMFCKLVQPQVYLEQLPLNAQMQQALRSLIHYTKQTHQPLQLYFYGARGVGKSSTASAIAYGLGMSLLVADLSKILDGKTNIGDILKILFREVKLQNAVLYLEGLDSWHSQEQAAYEHLLSVVAQDTGITILASRQQPSAIGTMIPLHFPLPDFTQRQIYWQTQLANVGITLSNDELNSLADRFRLAPQQIADAITTATKQAHWRAAASDRPLQTNYHLSVNDLFAAAKSQSSQNLNGLARKVIPRHHWDNIILPSDQLSQLQELCNQIKYRHIVCGEWGFEQKLSLGKGVNALFSGSPGTGKTMAAEIIANELQLELYKIDLSQIVSKYIGETEKNLDRVFTAAETTNAILLFDEADALFGKRSEVKDAHDRYANIEIAYLLQKMEEYEGITILTTNFRQNLDEAFVRRVRFIIEFPLPEADYRWQIWQGIWPKETPLGEDVNLEAIAQKFQLTGGNIRNIALAAAFLAAENSQPVSMKHLLQATKREFQKMGRLVNEDFLQISN